MSRVQFNLLPDVKLDYIKAHHARNLVVIISAIVSAVTLGIFLIMLLTVDVIQKAQLDSASKSIDSTTKQLQNVSDLPQALTIQSQLSSLSTLHQSKHVSSRIFTYIGQIIPINVSVSGMTLDLVNSKMTFTGTADSQQTVTGFIDTLKLITFKVGSTDSAHTAFTSVTESSYGLATGTTSYTLTINFDPKLFSNDLVDSSGHPQTPQLTLPKQANSRSSLDLTNNLFVGNTGITPVTPPSSSTGSSSGSSNSNPGTGQ